MGTIMFTILICPDLGCLIPPKINAKCWAALGQFCDVLISRMKPNSQKEILFPSTASNIQQDGLVKLWLLSEYDERWSWLSSSYLEAMLQKVKILSLDQQSSTLVLLWNHLESLKKTPVPFLPTPRNSDCTGRSEVWTQRFLKLQCVVRLESHCLGPIFISVKTMGSTRSSNRTSQCPVWGSEMIQAVSDTSGSVKKGQKRQNKRN